MRVEFLNSKSSTLLYTLEKPDVDHIDYLLKQANLYYDGSLNWSSMVNVLTDPLTIKLIPLVYEERMKAFLNAPNRYLVQLDSSEEDYMELEKRIHPIYPLYGKMLKQLLTYGRPKEPEYLRMELEKYSLTRFGNLEYSPSGIWIIRPFSENLPIFHADPAKRDERWNKAKGYLDSLGKGE